MAGKFTRIALSAAVLGTLITSAPVLASGSSGGASRGGGGFSTQQARDPLDAAYSRGKKRFKKQITCKTCEHKDGVKGKDAARSVALQVQTGDFNLTDNERQDVLVYIFRRYRL